MNVVFAQNVAEYGVIGAAKEAANQAWYTIASWFRSDRQTALLVCAGLLILVYALRKKRRRY